MILKRFYDDKLAQASYLVECAAMVLSAGVSQGRELEAVPQITLDELTARLALRGTAVPNLRDRAEWEAAHLPRLYNIPLGYLANRLDEIPRNGPLGVHCQQRGRSATPSSVLRSKSFDSVNDLAGGYADWQAAGHPMERSAATLAG